MSDLAAVFAGVPPRIQSLTGFSTTVTNTGLRFACAFYLNNDIFPAVVVAQFFSLLLGRYVVPEHKIFALNDIEHCFPPGNPCRNATAKHGGVRLPLS
jgi:hypothetical protein